MNGMHLSEEELQQYVLDKYSCSAGILAHVDTCPDCQAGIAAYSLLIQGLGEQPKPVFGFDVSALVMERWAEESNPAAQEAAPIPAPSAASQRPFRSYRYVMAAVILLITGIPALLFWKSAYYVFTDMSGVFLYPILAVTGVIVLGRVLYFYKRYQHLLNSLK